MLVEVKTEVKEMRRRNSKRSVKWQRETLDCFGWFGHCNSLANVNLTSGIQESQHVQTSVFFVYQKVLIK